MTVVNGIRMDKYIRMKRKKQAFHILLQLLHGHHFTYIHVVTLYFNNRFFHAIFIFIKPTFC